MGQTKQKKTAKKQKLIHSEESVPVKFSDKLLKQVNLSLRIVEKDELAISYFKILGEGGFGQVFKGTYKHTDVAIKKVRMAQDEKFIVRELLAMDQIRHPNFVSIIAASIDVPACMIVMEYFESVTFRKLISDAELNITLTKHHKDCLSKQVCVALDYLHDPKYVIVHEDIKPENILVNEQHIVKICDMGLSRANRLPNEYHTIDNKYHRSTPKYTAPELMSGKERATTHSDIWSTASVFAELYTGQIVWPVDTSDEMRAIYEKQEKPEILDCMESDLKDLLEKCFVYEPTKRINIETMFYFFDERINGHVRKLEKKARQIKRSSYSGTSSSSSDDLSSGTD